MNITAVPEKWLSSKGVKNPKMVIYVGVAMVSAVVLYLVVHRIVKNYRLAHPTQGSIMSGLVNELGSLSTGNATLTDAEAGLIAQNLMQAMNKLFSVDFNAVMDNLNQCKTAGDLNLVIQKFGIQFSNGFGMLSTGIIETKLSFTHFPRNLNEWLRDKLSDEHIAQVKAIYDNLGVPF